jgi:hypothetical protein
MGRYSWLLLLLSHGVDRGSSTGQRLVSWEGWRGPSIAVDRHAVPIGLCGNCSIKLAARNNPIPFKQTLFHHYPHIYGATHLHVPTFFSGSA